LYCFDFGKQLVVVRFGRNIKYPKQSFDIAVYGPLRGGRVAQRPTHGLREFGLGKEVFGKAGESFLPSLIQFFKEGLVFFYEKKEALPFSAARI
jgi:hypothetical protein